MAAEAPHPLSPREAAAAVKSSALALGFAAAGITDLAPTPHADALDRWLERGFAGTMGYMARQAARRRAPATIAAGATRAVVVLYNYMVFGEAAPAAGGRVARYAWGEDYHRGLEPALAQLAGRITSLGGPGTWARAFADAGPVPERELAQRAGLGWIGKNTMLIHPKLGSYTFIATVFTNANLAVDLPFAADRCGSCTRCLTACPTDAFPEPRVLDARQCVSYLTIEQREPIPDALANRMGSWAFGCDVCQEACPWNGKFAEAAPVRLLDLDPSRAWLPLDAFVSLDETAFERQYGWTPLERAGLHGMRRNMAVVERNATEAAP